MNVPRWQVAPVLWLTISMTALAAPPKRLPRDLYKSGAATRNAFRSVVEGASEATVAVLVDGRQKALGTIVGSDGWVLTKASQVNGINGGPISCRLKDGTTHKARQVGFHAEHDLAMLKIDAQELAVVSWQNAEDPAVGSFLATSGPAELPVAVGVVSIHRRRIPHLFGFLGIGFEDTAGGARISRVMPNSGASRIGLKAGDVITRVAGTRIPRGEVLRNQIRKFRPGEILPMRVRRGTVEFDANARLGSPAQHLQNRSIFMNKLGGQLSFRRGGFPNAFAHDTVLKPEQCGGPLVNLQGKVVGINIAREGRTESHAIPAAVIVGLIEDLKSGKQLAAPAFKLGPEEPPAVPLPRD
tara:strand:- start:2043 stop:3110 length:1068 start_codon:yes stop_codon:yes gene_type:complete